MRALSVLIWALALLATAPGCKKQPAAEKKAQPAAKAPAPERAATPTSAPEPAATAPEAQPPTDEPPPVATLTDARKTVLSETFGKAWGVMKQRDRGGLNEMYGAAGFKDAADFAQAWLAARQAEPQWAEAVMAQLRSRNCVVQGGAGSQ